MVALPASSSKAAESFKSAKMLLRLVAFLVLLLVVLLLVVLLLVVVLAVVVVVVARAVLGDLKLRRLRFPALKSSRKLLMARVEEFSMLLLLLLLLLLFLLLLPMEPLL